MRISPESSITLTWSANALVYIMIGLECAGSGFALFLQWGGVILGAGWSALPSSMVKIFYT